MNNPLAIIIYIIFFGTIFLVLYIKIKSGQVEKNNRRILQNAHEEYLSALESLKNNPTNADIKQNTLALGREYSSITRQFHNGNKSVTIYDELSLMNDINAACANVSKLPTIKERLQTLEELNQKELISEAEYELKRQQILNEI